MDELVELVACYKKQQKYYNRPAQYVMSICILNSNVTSFGILQVMNYEKELKIMETLTKEEYLASLRR